MESSIVDASRKCRRDEKEEEELEQAFSLLLVLPLLKFGCALDISGDIFAFRVQKVGWSS